MWGLDCPRGQRYGVRTWSLLSVRVMAATAALREPDPPATGMGGPGGAWRSRATRLSRRRRAGHSRPAPRSMTPRSRRSAREPVQSRRPPPHGLPCWPDRARAAYANADALDDRAHSRAAAAKPLSRADSRELSRHRTDHTAVSSRGRSRRERRRAEQRSSEHHGDKTLAREHHASLLFGWRSITAAPKRPAIS